MKPDIKNKISSFSSKPLKIQFKELQDIFEIGEKTKNIWSKNNSGMCTPMLLKDIKIKLKIKEKGK